MDLLAKETVIHPKPGPTIRKAKSFQFIVSSSPDHASQETRKLIKSHVSRNRDRRKKNSEMKSWIQRQSGSGKAPLVEHKIPERVGWDFSLLDFPEVLQAYMREDLTHCMLHNLDSICRLTQQVSPHHLEGRIVSFRDLLAG